MKCTKCGADIPEGSAFCPVCGQSTVPSEVAAANAPAQAPTQPNYQQPVYAAPQPTYAAPQPTVFPASPAEREALSSSTRGLWMLLASIVLTVNLVTSLISGILSLDIFGLIGLVLDILIVVGFWITYANGRKRTMSTKGLSLIKVPYIIQFVFTVIGFVFNVLFWGFTLQILSLVFGILSFVFTCICFASVKKSLNMALTISKGQSVAGRKAGIFAAVVMIISASFTFIQAVVTFVTVDALTSALAETPLAVLGALVSGGGVMSLVGAVITFLAGISVAVVLLMFAKKIKKAING